MQVALVLGDEGSQDTGSIRNPGPGWASPVQRPSDKESGIGMPKQHKGSGVVEMVVTHCSLETANGVSTRRRVLTKGLAVLSLLGLLVTGMLPGSASAESSPDWKIGRGVIQQSPGGAVLKLSLRNQGGPGRAPVRLAGRWVTGNGALVTLGQFSRQVALKQTAIVQVPLGSLGPRPDGAALELIVHTAGRQTDQRQIH